MGRGAYVRIENKSNRTLDISYQDISCMFQGGQEGSNFEPISGKISPNNCLPHTGEKQYIEKETSINPGNLCLYNNGFFTMKVKDASSQENLGLIKFEANLNGYRCTEKKTQNIYIDTHLEDDKIKVSITDDNPPRNISGYLYFEIEFNEEGKLIDSQVTNEVVQKLWAQEKITDLIVFIHGMNNTKKAARDIYEDYFEKMSQAQGNHESIAICGVIWPSQIMSGAKEWYETWYEKTINFAGNVAKIMPARTLGEIGLAAFLNALVTELNKRDRKIRIHLTAHSMGTVVLRGALSQLKIFINSVFFIQSPLPTNKLLLSLLTSALDSKLKESYVDEWVHGPIVCTYSNKDSLLAKIPFDTMGAKGFQELSSENVKILTLRSGTEVNYKDFDKRFISLDCRDVIDGHDNYKKSEVARSHLAAIKKSMEK